MSDPLSTDLYELTMAQACLRSGRGDDRAVFHLFFRRLPFEGGYAIAAGLETALELLDRFKLSSDALAYLQSLCGSDGKPLFDRGFLHQLGTLQLDVEIAAVPEGSVVFGYEPLVRVSGRYWHAQLLETALLNIINFQTLVATKAARIVQAARGGDVLEFGLRRAQGDAALSASRAAYIGGCAGTSHVLAGQRFGIPVRGTHAHSWVMVFDSELEAFEAYAHAQPNNCVLLVDTYSTLQGVRNAITVAHQLRERGARLLGIRLDSGDLAWLSLEARKLLDAAGLEDTQIIASNDLDEHTIESLVQQGAAIDAWGVGTRLVTAYDEPALGGVYKLSMIQPHAEQTPKPRIKLSEQSAKISSPGVQQIRRFKRAGRWVGDVIYDELLGCSDPCVMIDPLDPTRRKTFETHATKTKTKTKTNLQYEDLLAPVWRSGQRCAPKATLEQTRARVRDQLGQLDPTVRRLLNPHEYPVGLCERLYAERLRLIQAARKEALES